MSFSQLPAVKNQDDFLKSLFFELQKCVIPQKKSSEKSSFNFEIIFEVFFLKKVKKKKIFSFFDIKNFVVYVNRSQFSQKSWKKF